MFCRKCGNQINDDQAMFCPKCGEAINHIDMQSGRDEDKNSEKIPLISDSVKPPHIINKNKKKHPNSKKIIWLIFGIAFTIVIAICFVFANNKKVAEEDTTIKAEDGRVITLYRSSEDNIITNEKTGVKYVNNILIVTVDEDTTKEKVSEVVDVYDGTIVGQNDYVHTYTVLFDKEYSYDELVTLSNEIQSKIYGSEVTHNTVLNLELAYYPNDDKLKNDWDDTPSGKNWGLEAIGAPEMWDLYFEKNPSGINVGVLDNQFYTDHEDLNFTDVFLNNFDIHTSISNPNHGTHVAGIIAAGFDNKIGISGLIPRVKLYGSSIEGLAKRVYKKSEDGITIDEYEAGLAYLIGLKDCKVVNLSYGGGKEELNNNETYMSIRHLEKCLCSLVNQGFDFLIVKGAGNDHKNYEDYDVFAVFSEKKVLDRIITIGAAEMEKNGNIYVADYSNYGSAVDIIAPGTDIYSTICTDHSPFALLKWSWGWLGSDYTKYKGTSMAAPHVTGTAAAIWAANPDLTGPQVKKILCDTAKGDYEHYGYHYKMLNASGAMKAALSWKDKYSDEYTTTDVLNIETGEFSEELVNNSQVMQWNEFVSQYHDTVDWLGVGGDYTDRMHIAIFELRNEKGDVLKRNAMFNPSGFDYDPFRWGVNSDNSYKLPNEQFEKDYFYIRYKDNLVVGPANGEIFVEVLKDGATLLALDGLWSDGFNTLTISDSYAYSLEFMPYFTRLWSPGDNIHAFSSGRNGTYEFDNGDGFAGTISMEGNTLVLTVSPGSHPVADKTKPLTFRFTKVNDAWKTAYKDFLSSGEFRKTADYYNDQDIVLLLVDMTADHIPELLITSGGNARSTCGGYIYGCENGKVKLKTTTGSGLFVFSVQNNSAYFTISTLTGAQAEEPKYSDIVHIDWLKCEGNQIERKRSKTEKYVTGGTAVETEFFVGTDANDMYGLIQLALEKSYYSGEFKPQMYHDIYFTVDEALSRWDIFINNAINVGG